MTYSRTSITKALSAVVITCAVAAFYTVPAAAQTATNLNCGGCVKSKQLKNGGVKNKDLQDNAINSQKIADGTVGNADLGGDSVDSDKVLDNSLDSADVAGLNSGDITNEAGADFAGGNQTVNLGAADTSIRAVTISAPSAGRVIVNVSGSFDFNSAGFDSVRCSITNGAILVDGSNQITANDSFNNVSRAHVPFAGTRGFTVGAGATTFRLVCEELAGIVQVEDSQITAIFVPTAY